LVSPLLAVAISAHGAETARQILDRQRALDAGPRRWSDRHEQIELEVLAEGHAPRRMALDVFDKKYSDGQQKTMAYFSAPESVKGTALLAITQPGRPADQWLYLPESRRARRIGGELRKQGFVGTDFTYHDLDLLAAMPSWTEADASSSLRGEETVEGVPCFVIELTPRREDIGYQQIVVWLGRDDLIPRRVDLYETAPSTGWFGFGAGSATPPTRRFRQSDVRPVGAIPVPFHAEVETPSAGSKTVVKFAEIAFDRGLPDDLFTQPALEWGHYGTSPQ
jgi:hypothetical protein